MTGAPRALRGLDLREVRRDEQRHANAGGGELAHAARHAFDVGGHVEPAFGGDLGAILGHQAAVVRPHADGDLHHLVRQPHLEVHARLQQRPQRVHVAILDVPAVFAQMQRDVVRAGLLGQQRRMHRIRIRHAARLPHRRDVIDVDAELDVQRRSCDFLAAPSIAQPCASAARGLPDNDPAPGATRGARRRATPRRSAIPAAAPAGSGPNRRPRRSSRTSATPCAGAELVVSRSASTSNSRP